MQPQTRPEGVALDAHAATARLQALLGHAPAAVAFVRADRLERVSQHMRQLFGVEDGQDLDGLSTRVLQICDEAHWAFGERLAAAFEAGAPVDEEIELVRRDGSHFWARLQACPVRWDQPAGEQLWIIEDVTAARQLRTQPTWNGRHDPVTELANRRELERRLAEHVGSQRHLPVAMLWIALDRFDDVVARLGAQAGDRFLLLVGRVLVSKVRASDVVARLEADRFAVLLPDCDRHHAHGVGEKLRAAIAGVRLRWGIKSTKLTASVGVVQLDRSLATIDAVLDAAHAACRAAQAAGGDSVHVYAHPSTGGGEASPLE